MQAAYIKGDGDVVVGAALAARVNAGDDVAILAGGGEIQIGLRAHELDDFYVYLDCGISKLLNEFGVVRDVLGTDAHVDFLADALVALQLLELLSGNLDFVLTEYSIYAAVLLGQANGEEVHLGRADESGNEQVGGIVVEVLGGVNLLDETVLHNYDAGTHGHSFGLVVGYVDEGGLEALMELGDLSSHLNAQLSVEVGKRFVHKEDLGLTNDGATERNALSLTAGKSLGLTVEEMLDVEDASSFLNALVDLGLGGLAELKTESHVIINSHVRIQGVVLENHGDVAILGSNVVDEFVADVELTVGDLFETSNHSQGGGFSAAGRTYENDKFLIFDVQAEIAYSSYAAGINLVNVFQSYACH